MALIRNDDFIAGDAVDTADLNAKFTDVSAATTAALDDENFRDEAMDCLQFPSNASHGKNDVILVTWKMVENGVGQTGGTWYTSAVNGTAATPITHGSTNPRLTWTSGEALRDGDLLRVRWSVFLQELDVDPALYTTDGVSQVDCPVWLVWLQWDITSNALANWVEVPGQSTMLESFTSFEGGKCEDAQATMTLPHAFLTYGEVGVYDVWDDLANLTVQRAWSYVNDTGNTITIYGIRMVIAGLYHPANSPNTSDLNAFVREIASPGWSGDRIRIANARMVALIMRSA